MTTARHLYRGLSRIIHEFSREQIPLRGVVGQQWASPSPDNISYLQSIFRSSSAVQPQSIDDGMRALRQLQSQLEVLTGAEESTREAMATWLGCERDSQKFRGDEDRLALFFGAAQLGLLSTAAVEEGKHRVEFPVVSGDTIRKLTELATEVNDAAPGGLFEQPTSNGGGSGSGSEATAHTREQLQHISQVLFEKHKYRQTPFEWVYDGLSPVLLPTVLHSRKGLSITLATIYTLVAHHLGLRLVMAPLPRLEVPTLSTDLAAMHIQRTTIAATAPAPADWAVYAPGSPMLRVDPLAKGAVTEVDPADPVHLAPKPAFHMAVWAELARIMMTAHQRRGESDEVAHWTYQLLALDPEAPEWEIFGPQ